jgi:hypothetical protein
MISLQTTAISFSGDGDQPADLEYTFYVLLAIGVV